MANKYMSLPVKFNVENEQDMLRWKHVEGLKNRQAYIKDLIFLDIMFDLFNGGIEKVKGVHSLPVAQREENAVVEEEAAKPDLSDYDTNDVLEF